MIHLYEVIEKVKELKTKEEKINFLRKNESWALKDLLKGSYDPSIEWLIPKGKPPFEHNLGESTPTTLLKENTQFRYFVKGGPGQKMMKAKREKIYLALLEGIHPKDAELVISMVSKKSVVGIPKKVAKEAFPGLIND